MKNKELFDRTVAVLVRAYKNDTLKHGSCHACAVGNIVAAGCGINDVFSDNEWREKALVEPQVGWVDVFCACGVEQITTPENYKGAAKFQIDSTGYTWQELAKIEHAFETAPKGNSEDEWMLNGLLAVYDVLCEIHEVADKSEVEDAKLVFVK